MDLTAGIFEHDQAFDDSARVAGRQAVAVANKRAKDSFGAFLAQATDDFHARFALVEDELAQVAEDAAEEYGVDAEGILASITSVLSAGGFCDDCRKWKSGPKKGCECSGSEPAEGEDGPAESNGYDDPDDPEVDETGEPYDKESRVASWTVLGEALETVDLPKGDDTALDGPSPKMDKGEWKPNALNGDGNLSPVDTEGSGSPHPTVQQDITDVADHTKDPLEQTDAVADHGVDVGKEHTTEAIHTDTWSGSEGLADPVTSAAHDVERNPLRTMMEQGIIPQQTVTAAISAFETRG